MGHFKKTRNSNRNQGLVILLLILSLQEHTIINFKDFTQQDYSSGLKYFLQKNFKVLE